MHLNQLFIRILSLAIGLVVLNTIGVFGQSRFFSEEIRYSIHAKTSVLFSNIKGEYNKRERVPNYKLSPSFGAFLSVAINDHLAIEPGIAFSLRGSKTKINHSTKISNDEINIYISDRGFEETHLHYLEVPVMVCYRMESRLTVGLGFSASVLLKSGYEQHITTTQIVNNTVATTTHSFSQNKVDEMKGTDAAILFSIGYILKDGLEVTGNVYNGLVDVRDESRDFKNTGFGLSLAYRFKQL